MSLKPVYTPPPGLRTPLDDFREFLNLKYSLSLSTANPLHNFDQDAFVFSRDYADASLVQSGTFADVHDFSIHRLNDFWLSFWDFTKVRASSRPTKVH